MSKLCPCKFPVFIKKDGEYLMALPLDMFEEKEDLIPWIHEEKGDDGKDWVVVQWEKVIPGSAKKYDLDNNHIVYAGCDEKDIKCDVKSIYSIWHPKEEWESKEHKLDYEDVDVSR